MLEIQSDVFKKCPSSSWNLCASVLASPFIANKGPKRLAKSVTYAHAASMFWTHALLQNKPLLFTVRHTLLVCPKFTNYVH